MISMIIAVCTLSPNGRKGDCEQNDTSQSKSKAALNQAIYSRINLSGASRLITSAPDAFNCIAFTA